MTGAERVRRYRTRRRARLARETATLPVNQVLTGHAAEVMANWPSNSIDLIVTSPPYFDLVEYEGGLPWNSYAEFLDDMQGVWIEAARVLRPNGKLALNAMMVPIAQTPEAKRRKEPRRLYDLAHDFQQRILKPSSSAVTGLRLFEKFVWQKQTTIWTRGAYPTPGNNLACNTTEATLGSHTGRADSAEWIDDNLACKPPHKSRSAGFFSEERRRRS
jgi:hypothetical protein